MFISSDSLRYFKWNAIHRLFSSKQEMGLVWQSDKILTAARMCDCWMKDMCRTWNNQQIKMFDKVEEKCGERMQQSAKSFVHLSAFLSISWITFIHLREIAIPPFILASRKCVVVCAKINDPIARNNKPISNIGSALFYWISKWLFSYFYVLHNLHERVYRFVQLIPHNTIPSIYRLHITQLLLLLFLHLNKNGVFFRFYFINVWEQNSHTKTASTKRLPTKGNKANKITSTL